MILGQYLSMIGAHGIHKYQGFALLRKMDLKKRFVISLGCIERVLCLTNAHLLVVFALARGYRTWNCVFKTIV